MTEVFTCPTCGGSGTVDPPSSARNSERTLLDRDQTTSDAGSDLV